MEGLSQKQISLIDMLARSLDVDALEFATELFGKPIDRFEMLTKRELSKLINTLKGRQLLSPIQLDEIINRWTIDQLRKILKKPELQYQDLTAFHYRLLMTNKFQFKSVDHPIENTVDYEFGWQTSPLCPDGKMYYLKFYDLMMIDFDGLTLDELKVRLTALQEQYTFKVYKTYNGFHAYVVSTLINHRNGQQLMNALDCDFFYIKFAWSNGYKIRLTPKLGREEPFIEQYVCTIGRCDIDAAAADLLAIRAEFLGAD